MYTDVCGEERKEEAERGRTEAVEAFVIVLDGERDADTDTELVLFQHIVRLDNETLKLMLLRFFLN